ncbi:hypothetical protein OIU77_012405 [Salix suchowensis]|uniref:Uncharacterized protein n=1 Tax=Salix suchowensis TaxID=1278906 RepID=A0ABQ9A4B6_9ROSI|nr:hypothetical protein OIU77_012405 [Salix suchowensis]
MQILKNLWKYYDKAADFFQNEDVTTSANQCKQKVAEFSARLEQYQTSIDIYEDIARQSLKNNLLKYGVKGHLLNAGLCHLCKGDVVCNYQRIRAISGDGSNIFQELVNINCLRILLLPLMRKMLQNSLMLLRTFDSMTPLDSWKTTLLLRVKEKLKAKELEEDDLT